MAWRSSRTSRSRVLTLAATGLFALHGALVLVAWVVLGPVCVLVARYLKVTPSQDFPRIKDKPFWWRWHWHGQFVAVALSTAGFAITVAAMGGFAPTTWHG